MIYCLAVVHADTSIVVYTYISRTILNSSIL